MIFAFFCQTGFTGYLSTKWMKAVKNVPWKFKQQETNKNVESSFIKLPNTKPLN